MLDVSKVICYIPLDELRRHFMKRSTRSDEVLQSVILSMFLARLSFSFFFMKVSCFNKFCIYHRLNSTYDILRENCFILQIPPFRVNIEFKFRAICWYVLAPISLSFLLIVYYNLLTGIRSDRKRARVIEGSSY